MMNEVPRWIIKALIKERIKCSNCNNFFAEKSLIAIGIRRSNRKVDKSSLYVELACYQCKQVTMFEITNMGLVEFAFEILGEQTNQAREEFENTGRKIIADAEVNFQVKSNKRSEFSDIQKLIGNRKSRKKPRIQKSRITFAEIKETVKFLNSNKCKTHDDFLYALGMSPEEIDKYKIKRDK